MLKTLNRQFEDAGCYLFKVSEKENWAYLELDLSYDETLKLLNETYN